MASNPAPGELELVRSFINTWDADEDVENVPGPDELRDWLAGHGLLDADAGVTEADHRHAIEVREALRAVLLANSGLDLDPDARAGARRRRRAGAARRALRRRGSRPHRPGGRRRRRGDGPPAGDRRRRPGGRHVAAAQGLSGRRLPVGLLRPVAQPLGGVVRHEDLRQPPEGALLPRAPPPPARAPLPPTDLHAPEHPLKRTAGPATTSRSSGRATARATASGSAADAPRARARSRPPRRPSARRARRARARGCASRRPRR